MEYKRTAKQIKLRRAPVIRTNFGCATVTPGYRYARKISWEEFFKELRKFKPAK